MPDAPPLARPLSQRDTCANVHPSFLGFSSCRHVSIVVAMTRTARAKAAARTVADHSDPSPTPSPNGNTNIANHHFGQRCRPHSSGDLTRNASPAERVIFGFLHKLR